MRKWLRRRQAALALLLALASIGLNVYLLQQLRHPERWAEPAVRRLLAGITGGDDVVEYTVRIPRGTPLALDVPVQERFTSGVDTVIPVRTRVRIPFETPLGTRSVVVPLRADIPLRTRLPLDIRHTFRLRTQTTQEIAIPIQIRLGDVLK